MSSEIERLYQEIVLDHNRNPRGYGAPAGADRHAHGENPFCGDRITVHLHLAGDVVEAVGFEAQSCAIAKASASMMTQAVRGLTVTETAELFDRFNRLVNGGTDPDAKDRLGDLVALGGVAAFPVRIACAVLPWTTLADAVAPGRE